MVTREWAAIHRKHHARCETNEDPHSPQRFGIRKVLLEGAELYRQESAKPQTLERYGYGTPNDWVERHVYGRFSILGISLLLIAEFALFGFIGITIWALQMIWIPFMAAGVINGIRHYWGYRTFEPADASRNIVPWGILIGGEELHNNHHAHVTSARLSNRAYEFDIGWMHIRILETVGLARVKRIAPTLTVQGPAYPCDASTLQAIVVHRHEALAQFCAALGADCTAELHTLAARGIVSGSLEHWLHETNALPGAEHRRRARRGSEPGAHDHPCHARGPCPIVAALDRLEGAARSAARKLVPPRRGKRHRGAARVCRFPAWLPLCRVALNPCSGAQCRIS
jgi:stearoyl-CoA desaturase (delta-9 desaturase)